MCMDLCKTTKVSVSFLFERLFLADMKDRGHISIRFENRFESDDY